jgi:hypothetical protein
MRKFNALAALLLLLLIPATLPSRAMLLGGSGATRACIYSGNNVTDTAGNTDGCAGANLSSAKYISNLFTGFIDATYTNSHPPNWDVAGVDYPVGPYTASGSLIACTSSSSCPTSGISPPGCATVSGNAMTVQSAPCAIKGYHFTGMCVGWVSGITSGVITITDNLFTLAAGCDSANTKFVGESGSGDETGTQEVIFTFNEVDETYSIVTRNVSSYVAVYGGGTTMGTPACVIEYNYFHDGQGNTFELDSQNTSNSGSVCEIHYNIISNTGSPGSHSDNPYFGGAPGFDYQPNMSFNTVVAYTVGNSATGSFTYSSQINSGYIQIGGYIQNNIIIANDGNGSDQISAFLIRCCNTGYTLPGIIVDNNWYDATSSFGFLTSPNQLFFCTGNKNLIDGTVYTNTFGSYSCT